MDVAASTLEAIARYAPQVDIPPPAVLDQARRNIQLQVAMLTEFGALSAGEVAELAGSRARRPGGTVDSWRRAHKIVAVRWQDDTLVPGFLLTDGGQADPVARPALRHLAERGFSAWQAALWCVIPAPALDAARPVDVLLTARRGDPDVPAATSDRLLHASRRHRNWL